jgi:hypothetical protein
MSSWSSNAGRKGAAGWIWCRSNGANTMQDAAYARWKAAEAHCCERWRADSQFDVPGYFFDNGIGWIELIKTLRLITGASLTEAQTIALRHLGWRRWCEARTRADARCAKDARLYARQAGRPSVIAIEDGRLVFRY